MTKNGQRPLITNHDYKRLILEAPEDDSDDDVEDGDGGGGGSAGGGGGARGVPVIPPEQFARSSAIQIVDSRPVTAGTQLSVEQRGLERISFNDDIDEGGFYFLDADRRNSLPRDSRALRTVDLDSPVNTALSSATLTFTLRGDTDLSRYDEIMVYRRGSVEPPALPTNVTRPNGTVTVTAQIESFSDLREAK